MDETPYHKTLKELTTAQKQTNKNLLKINESIKTQMSGVAKAVSEPPPTDVEGDREKKTENKKFSFKTFMNAFSFMNIIADHSEKIDHHPKLINEYNVLEIELYTHSSNSIAKKDFLLAEFIDNIYEEIFS